MISKTTIGRNLASGRLLQLATVNQSQPWICTVYFVHDEQLNLYWLSWPERRHSQEIAQNDKVAAAIVVKPDQPVIGIQAEGRAEIVKNDRTVTEVLDKYVKKYAAGKDFIRNYQAGTNHHQLYKFVPTKYVLFDEHNFSGDQARQELVL